MALRTIRTMGDPVLEKKAKEVSEMTERLKTLIADMLETMYEENGVGLAAPQVTYVMKELKEAGFDVDENATTLEEAKNEILRVFR